MRMPLGPSVVVALRDPTRSARDLSAWVAVIAPLVRAAGARLVVSGRVDLAVALGLAGVHLPARGLSVEDARALLPPGSLVGRSCHDLEELRASEGADYVTLSPVGAVPGKAPPLGMEGFERLARSSPLPVLALGGVSLAQAAELSRRGAHGIAVRRAIDTAHDPSAALRRFLGTFPERVSG